MSHSIHPNLLSVTLGEHQDAVDTVSIHPTLRFLEVVDYEEEALRQRRRRRASFAR
mgnify:CR=1 FL=1